MVINKIGRDHILEGKNNQDFYYAGSNMVMVVDGCSQGKHSEVGAKLFIQLFERLPERESMELFEENLNKVFSAMISLAGDPAFMLNNMCFTIIACFELEDKFIIKACGDGYIIAQDLEGNIGIAKIDNGDYPKYWVYNFIPPEYLEGYKEGVSFESFEYLNESYSRVGVATDGIRFWEQLPEDEKCKFIELLHLVETNPRKAQGQMGMLINRNSVFKDDITICF